MKRYALIGNCVTGTLARCLQFFEPGAAITSIAVSEIGRHFSSFDEMLSGLQTYDMVFIYDFEGEGSSFWGAPGPQTVAHNIPHCVIYPKVVFAGYHPDQVFAFDRETGQSLDSPLVHSHSAIALYGYLRGYDAATIRDLYCRPVFERLGYFAVWNEAVATLVSNEFARAFRLHERVLSWAREGCFMHSIIHPKIVVLADLAREMLSQAGAAPRWRGIGTYVHDQLIAGPVWPIYPELGEYFNLEGEYVFKRHEPDAQDGRWPLYLDLDEFIRASLACYSQYDPARIACARVEKWVEEDVL